MSFFDKIENLTIVGIFK